MSESSDPQMGPIGAVHQGMSVLDASGEEVGTVDFVKMSDPGIATSAGETPPSGADGRPGAAIPGAVPGSATGVATGGAGTGAPAAPGVIPGPFGAEPGAGEPDVPGALAERLQRTGYLKIDSKGLFRRDVYVGADQITDVDEVVHLGVTKDELTKES